MQSVSIGLFISLELPIFAFPSHTARRKDVVFIIVIYSSTLCSHLKGGTRRLIWTALVLAGNNVVADMFRADTDNSLCQLSNSTCLEQRILFHSKRTPEHISYTLSAGCEENLFQVEIFNKSSCFYNSPKRLKILIKAVSALRFVLDAFDWSGGLWRCVLSRTLIAKCGRC